MEPNTTQTPSPQITQPLQNSTVSNLHLAGFWSRAFAQIIDSIFLALVVAAPLTLTGLLTIRSFFISPNGETTVDVQLVEDLLRALAGIILLVYFIFFEARSGQSLGKKLLHIRVVNIDGGKITLKQAIIRNIMRMIDNIVLLVPILLIIFTPTKQRLGDLVAKTVVIHEGTSIQTPTSTNPPQPQQPPTVVSSPTQPTPPTQ